MLGLSSFLPKTYSDRALSPELISRLGSQLIPEEGSRSEFKNALFEAYDLGIEVRQAEMDLMYRDFAGYAKEMFNFAKCEPAMLLPMDLLYERDDSTSAFRKVYRPNGETAVLWDRCKGKKYFDDS